MIQGVDRSHHNTKARLTSLVKQGIQFIFFKATEGETNVDPTFNASWREAKSTPGLIMGCYHFFDPTLDGIIQAKHYLTQGVNFSAIGCLPPWVDVEYLVAYDANGKIDPVGTTHLNKWVADNWKLALTRLNDFMVYVKANTGRDCGIYSYNNYMKEYLHGAPFKNNPMWLSSLQKTCPKRYDTGNLPDFWQNTYNWNGTDMDGNFFKGDLVALKKMANFIA